MSAAAIAPEEPAHQMPPEQVERAAAHILRTAPEVARVVARRYREPDPATPNEELEKMLETGTCHEACGACRILGRRLPVDRFFFKVLLTWFTLLGGIALLSAGLAIGAKYTDGLIMIELGSVLLVFDAFLVFCLLPPENPVRVRMRHARLFCSNKQAMCPGIPPSVYPAAAALLAFSCIVIAAVMSAILIHSPGHRKQMFMRATVAMWVLAFVFCIPCGGRHRLREWLREPDLLDE